MFKKILLFVLIINVVPIVLFSQSTNKTTTYSNKNYLGLFNYLLELTTEEPKVAPDNPEYLDYLEKLKSGTLERVTKDGHYLGLMPHPYQRSNVVNTTNNINTKKDKMLVDPPSSYDATNVSGTSYVTSVKDQGNCGSCWSFASMGSLESRFLKLGLGTKDFSEQNLKNCHGYYWDHCDGGTEELSTAYFTRLDGPILESQQSYNVNNSTCVTTYAPQTFVTEAIYLDGQSSTVLKNMLMEYGALYTDMYWGDNYYNSSNQCYRYTGSASWGNHAVTLVGWDDTKSVTVNGSTSTGAWKIKNSWGTYWGSSGYFWIAYNDVLVHDCPCVWPTREDYNPNLRMYNYDEVGQASSFGYTSYTTYGLVKFVASSNLDITRIGTYITSGSSNVTIEVYDDFNTGTTTLSNLLGSISQTSCTYAGYKTFTFSNPISINSGNDFYVKVKYNTPGYQYSMPIERYYSGYSEPTIETGKCWFSSSGNNGSWTAMGNSTSYPYDICVRALTLCRPYVKDQTTTAQTCSGGSVNFYSTVSTGTATSMIWQYSTNSGSAWSNLANNSTYSGVTTTALGIQNASSGMNNYQYRLLVTNSCSTTTLRASTLTIAGSNPSIANHPQSTTVSLNNNTSFTTSASGAGNYNYQWEFSTNTGANWANVNNTGIYTGATTTRLSLSTVQSGYNNYYYRARVWDACGTVTSNSAVLTVNSSYLAVIQHPNAATICENNTAYFNASITGTPTPTLQWQLSSDNGITWYNLQDINNYSGVSTQQLAKGSAPSSINGYRYRLYATNTTGTIATNSAILTIQTQPTIYSNPVNVSANQGTSTSFNSSFSGSPVPSYQWQISSDSGNNWYDVDDGGVFSGATTNTLSLQDIPSSLNNYYFRAAANNTCGTANSGNALLTVNDPILFTSDPVEEYVCAGNSASFSGFATGTPSPTYRWQESTDWGYTWYDLESNGLYVGVTTTRLQITNTIPDMEAYSYRLSAGNSGGTAYSAQAYLWVDYAPSLMDDPENSSVTPGSSTSFYSSFDGYPYIDFQWYYSSDNGSSWNALEDNSYYSGATTQLLSLQNIPLSFNLYRYRLYASNDCGSEQSHYAILYVNSSLVINSHPSNTTICSGNNAQFSASVTGSPAPTYRWQKSTDGGSNWNNINNDSYFSGATTQILTITNTSTNLNNNRFRLRAGNEGNTLETNSGILTVNYSPIVTDSPDNIQVGDNGNAAFSGSASGSPAPGYQWYLSTNDGSNWSLINNNSVYSGATTRDLYVSGATLAMDGYRYRFIASNTCGTVTSDYAVLSISTELNVTNHPTDAIVCSGNVANFSASITGNPSPVYRWQVSTDNGGYWAIVNNNSTYSGVTTQSLYINNTNSQFNGRLYRLTGENDGGIIATNPATLTIYQAPTFTSHPGNVSITIGSNTQFYGNATAIPSANYQWQVSIDNGSNWSNLNNGGVYNNVTSQTLSLNNVPYSMNNYKYRLYASNLCGNAYSNVANLTVSTSLEVVSHPANSTICSGNSTSFYSNITGNPTPTYRWQESTDSGTNWYNINNSTTFSGATTQTLIINNANTAMSLRLYRLTAANEGGTTQSNPSLLVVNQAPAITNNPENSTVVSGSNTQFYGAASGTPAPSYQWQVSTNNGSSWSNINNTGVYSGATTQTLSLANVTYSMNNYRYRLYASNSCGNITTEYAVLNVTTSLQVVSNPSTSIICTGYNTSFTASITGNPTPTYRWQESSDSGNSWYNVNNNTTYSGATTQTLSINNVTSDLNLRIYKLIGGNDGGTVQTNVCLLVVYQPPSITSNPENSTISNGTNTQFYANASGSPAPSYQWQVSTDGGTNWNDVYNSSIYSGATSQTLSLANVSYTMNNFRYRLKATNTCGSSYSNNAVLNVTTTLEVVSHPSSSIICSGNNASFSASITGNPSPTYRWQESTDSGSNWANLNNNTTYNGVATQLLTISNASSTLNLRTYRLTAGNGGATTQTNVALLVVNQAPVINAHPSNSSVNNGANTQFNGGATGTPVPSYQWQLSTDNGINWSNINNGGVYSGATTQTLSLVNITYSMNNFRYRLKATNTCGDSYTNNALLSVSTSLQIVSHPSNSTICSGTNTSFSASITGNPIPTYQWQISSDDGSSWSNIINNTTYSGATTQTLTLNNTPSSLNLRLFRLFAGNGTTIQTNSCVLTVNQAPTVSTQPLNSTIANGANTQFYGAASGNPAPSYQWQVSTDNGAFWNNINNTGVYSGATTQTLSLNSVPFTMNNYRFRFYSNNNCGNTTSSYAVLNVTTSLEITEQPENSTICEGNNTSFYAEVTGNPIPTYRWQESNDNGNNWNNINNNTVYSGASTANLILMNCPANYSGKLLRLCTGNGASTLYTNNSLLTVNTAPSITNTFNNLSLCENTSATISSNVTGTQPITYQWQKYNGSVWVNMPNENHSSLVLQNVTEDLNYSSYRLNVSNSCGSSTSNSFNLLIKNNPEIITHPSNETIAAGETVCLISSANGFNPISYQWQYSTNYGSSWINVNNSSTFSGATSTRLCINNTPLNFNNYRFKLLASNDCLNNVASNYAVLSVVQGLVVDAGSNADICYGFSTTLSGSINGGLPPYNYYWYPSVGLSSTSILNPVANPITTTTYTLTTSDSQGRQSSDFVIVRVNPLLTAEAGTNREICYGESTQLQASATGGTQAYSYNWSPANGLSATNVPNPIANPLSTTQYTITITDSRNCQTIDNVTVTVNPQLIANAGNDREICYGTNTQLQASATGGTQAYSYNWSPANGLSATNIANPIANPLSTTQYTVTVTDSKNCQVIDNVIVTVNPQLIANAGNDREICYGESTQLQASATGGSQGYTYLWSPSTGLSANNIANPIASPLGTTEYTCLITDSRNCEVSDNVIITVNPQLTANAGNDREICYGESTQLQASASGGSQGYTYLWSPSTGLSANNIANPIANPLVTTEYTCLITDSHNCEVSDNVIVAVNPQLLADAGNDREICYGESTQLQAIATGGSQGYTYLWSPSTGLSAINIANPVANPLVTTEYNCLITDSHNCQVSDNIVITVNPQLIANAGNDREICYGESTQLQASAIGGNPTYSYFWSPSEGLSANNIANPIASPDATTQYTCIITDSHNCQSTDFVVVNVNPQLSANGGNDREICYGESTQLNANVVGGSPGYTYYWSPSLGLSANNIANPVANPLATIQYTLVVTDSKNCQVVDNITISVNPQLFANAGNDREICYGASTQLNASANGGSSSYTYHWSPNTGLSNVNIPNPIANPLSNTTYTCVVTDSHNCQATHQVTINVNPQLFANAGADREICYGESTQLNANATGGSAGYSYSWSPSLGLSATNIANPIANPLLTTEYTCTITDSHNCQVSDKVIVNVNPQLTANAGLDKEICYGDETLLNGSASGGSEIYSYLWSPSTGLSAVNIAEPTAQPLQTTLYTLVVTDSKGCQSVDRVLCIVNPLPQPNIQGDDEVSSNTTTNYSTPNATGISNLWSVSGGQIQGSNSGFSIEILWGPSGEGKVKLIQTNNQTGCNDSTELEININLMIIIPEGWNLISSYVNPNQPDIAELFTNIENLVVLRNQAGDVYYPALDINNIGDWQVEEGYAAYMTASDTLIISGEKVVPEETPISLISGWNIIAYLRDNEMNAEDAFADITDDMVLARNSNGDIYMPSFGINNIGNLQMGEGYELYMTNSATLVYPENSFPKIPLTGEKNIILSTYNKNINKTDNYSTFIIKSDIPASKYDGIIAFDESGKRIGQGKLFKGMALINIWGDNIYTKQKDGVTQNENITFKYFNNNNTDLVDVNFNNIYELTTNTNLNKIAYIKNGIYIVEIKSEDDMQNRITLDNIPNPFDGITRIVFSIPEDAKISLDLYTLHGVHIASIVNSEYKAGTYEEIFDGTLLGSGVYNLVLKNGVQTLSKFIILNK